MDIREQQASWALRLISMMNDIRLRLILEPLILGDENGVRYYVGYQIKLFPMSAIQSLGISSLLPCPSP
jgi:hypothetical protein